MRTEEIVEVKTAVAVTEEALKLVCQRIEEIAAKAEPEAISGRRPKVLYHGELVGGNKFSFETAEDLLAYPNRYDRRIITLIISLSLGFRDREISVIVSENAGSYAFKGSSSGEVGEAVRNKHHLEDFAAAIRAPWRWMWWHTGDMLFALVFGFILFLVIGVPFLVSDGPPVSPTPAINRSSAILTLCLVGVIGAIFVLYLELWSKVGDGVDQEGGISWG